MLAALATLALTYLLAAIPFGLVITTLYGGDQDIRTTGSGNIGATNVARVYGWRLAGPVVTLDIAKGLLPVLYARTAFDWGLWWWALIGMTAFVGHCFSVFLEFRGGKGVATGAGAMLAIAPIPTGAAVVLWGAVLFATGRSSVAALGAATALIALMSWLEAQVLPVAVLLGAGIAYTHTANIRRLVRGEEKQVIRPVSWSRTGETGEINAAALLEQGPAGNAAAPALWREEIGDPLETNES